MTWPNVLPNSAAFDADADSVAASRPELKKMSDAVNSIADFVNPTGIGAGQFLYYDPDSSNGRLIVINGTLPVDFAGTPTFNDREVVYTGLPTSGTITPDVANGGIQSVTLSGNLTMNAFANAKAGQRLTMIFRQPAAGSTFDLTSNMLWENGLESLTQINSAVDTAEIFYDGTNYFARMNLAHGSVEVYDLTINPLQEDFDVNNFKIVNNVSNGHVVLEPNGTGAVQLNTDTLRVGTGDQTLGVTNPAIITTNGNGHLILNTNNQGTSAAYIEIQSGTVSNTGNIDIEPGSPTSLVRIKNLYTWVDSQVLIQGTSVTVGVPGGQVSMGDSFFPSGFTCSGAAKITPGSALTAENTNIDSAGSAIQYNRIFVSRGTAQDGPDINDMILQTYQNRVLLGVYNQNQTLSTHGAGDLTINTNTGLNSGYIKIFDGVDGNIEITTNGTGDVQLNADTVRVGDSNSLATVSSNGTGSLLLTTNNGGTGAEQFIQIANGENGKITIQTDLIAGGGPGGMINLRSFRTVLGPVGGYASAAIITTEEDSAGYSPSIIISPGEVKPGGFLSASMLPRIELKSIGDIDIFAGNDPGGSSINFGYSLVKNLTLQNYFEKVHNLGNQTGNLPFIDAQNGNIQRMRLTGNVTFRGFFGQGDGQTITLIIQQDGTGNRTFTEGLDSANNMLFAGGVSTLSTGANAIDIMTISFIAGTYFASINKGYV